MTNPTNPKHHDYMTTITLENLPAFITTRGVDTLMISKLLRQLDFSEQQADVVSELMKQSNVTAEKIVSEKIELHKKESEINLNEMATKGDLIASTKELELQIEKVRSETEKIRSDLTIKIEQVRSDLIRWVAGLMLAQAGLLFTLLKTFTNL